jgi:hypothetical protein
MVKARTIRMATALTVIGVGVPLTVIANSRSTQAGTTPTGAVTQVGSAAGTASGARAATGATSTGTSSGTTAASASGSGTSGNLPADKMTVGGSKIVVSTPDVDVVLLQAQMRTSNVADLVFQVTSECSIITTVTTTGNDTQRAAGTIRMWVTVDGQQVGVIPSTQGTSDDGKVVFCNQEYSSTTSGFTADPNATIKTYLATKHADGFNWVAMNVGNGVHTIQLHGYLTPETTDPAKDMAQMVVGNRTMVVNVTTNAQNTAS